MSFMKKIIAVIAIVLILGGFVVFHMNMPMDSSMPMSSSVAYKDGIYTGSVGSASQYGDIQVKVTISGGKITDIAYLQFPSGPGHTDEVTAMAQPALKQEAIQAQSANVNVVSGATQDTQGFIQSLQSALDQAKS